jgi:DNA-binding SARP family transcriptional activator
MERLHLNLLGRFELRHADGTSIRLPTRKAEALLAYLALEGRRGLGREHLGSLLWEGADEPAARASLRQALSLIGKACGRGVLLADGGTIRLAEPQFHVDVLAFEHAAVADDAATLARAAALYRGELLAGMTVQGAEFEAWLQASRLRLHEQALDALAALGRRLQLDGRPDEALPPTLRLLELDPLNEAGHRALMQLYARLGRRAAALRQYELCVGALRRELGVEPEAATRALVNELLRQQPTRASVEAGPEPPASAPPVAPLHEAALVGRGTELATLRDALRAACSGRGQLVVMLGEAGVGKTRLTEELGLLAQGAGLRMLVGRSHESQRLFPFAPWVEALRGGGVPHDAALMEALGAAWRRDLAALLPEIAPDAPAVMPEGSAHARQARLFEAVIRTLERLAAAQPTLLVMEDAHWSDPPSLQLLVALARRSASWPLFVLLTIRDEDLPTASRLQRTLHELTQGGAGGAAVTRMTLRALTRSQTDTLVRALHGTAAQAAIDAEMRAHLWALSEGNPLVVVEAWRALRDAPLSRQQADVDLPERVRDLILGQVARLEPTARHLLALVAVAGREIGLPLLRQAAGLGLRRAAETAEELVRRRLLRLAGEAFDFTHARVRQVVGDSLLPPVRQAMHLALARAIEREPVADVAAREARLAYHYGQTDRHAQAVRHIAAHAQHAAHEGAHAQALELLAQARQHAARLPAPQAATQRRELLLREARSLFFLGRFDDVMALLQPEQAAFDAAGDPRAAAAYYLRLGSTRTYLGDHAGSSADAERALREARSCRDRATMGKAHFLLSLERFWDQPELGVRHGEQAVELLQREGETWWTGQACWILGLNLSYRGRFAEGLAMEARAAALADDMADRRLASYAAWTSGFIQALAGNLDAALQDCRRSVELALDPLNRMTSLGILSLTLVERRETGEARRLLAEAIPQALQFRIPQMQGLFLAFRAEAELLCGELGPARASVAEATSITQAAGYRYGEGWAWRVAARAERTAGDADSAQRLIDRSASTFEAMGAPYEAARTRLEQALWLRQAGRRRDAERTADLALKALAALGLDSAPALARIG